MFCSTCGRELDADAQAAGVCPSCGTPIVAVSAPAPSLPPDPAPTPSPANAPAEGAPSIPPTVPMPPGYLPPVYPPQGYPPQASGYPPPAYPPQYAGPPAPQYPAQPPPWQSPAYQQAATTPEDPPQNTGLIAGLIAIGAVILVLLLVFVLLIPRHNTTTPVAKVPTLPPQPTSILNGGGGNGGGNGGGGIVQPLNVDQFRAVYGFDKLIAAGDTGKGQTIVDIVSFGSPQLQSDMDAFDQLNNLPAITIKILSPLGTVPFDPNNQDQAGWAGETTLDVEIMHALAPDAGIVVLTSPVSETEGTAGLPQFLQLEQYAYNNHLGAVVSQSWGASEATLTDSASQSEIQQWDTFYHQTTQQGITYLAGSGDFGATDALNTSGGGQCSPYQCANAPTSSFPDDDPWVTAVGGTTVTTNGNSYSEQAWSGSGGGFSTFYSLPSYQQSVASKSSTSFGGKRGIPDVSADADPSSGLNLVIGGIEQPGGGTSASTPLWAALVAIANQMAGHNLGFINSALYSVAGSSKYATDFHDVTSGDNMVQVDGNSFGYNTTTGWDAVTGLGTPNAPTLIPDLISAAGSSSGA